MTPERLAELGEVQVVLGVAFRRLALLDQSLTHASYLHEAQAPERGDNERLEFLGDAVLELAISAHLYRRFPSLPEGEMAKIRAAVVCEASLADAARRLRLGAFLLMGRGEEKTGGRQRDSLLADAFEAVVGALYLDRGFLLASRFVLRELGGRLEGAIANRAWVDPKGALQEHLQREKKETPVYMLREARGPDHARLYVSEVSHAGKVLGRGQGPSKKAAEQAAARLALLALAEEAAAGLKRKRRRRG